MNKESQEFQLKMLETSIKIDNKIDANLRGLDKINKFTFLLIFIPFIGFAAAIMRSDMVNAEKAILLSMLSLFLTIFVQVGMTIKENVKQFKDQNKKSELYLKLLNLQLLLNNKEMDEELKQRYLETLNKISDEA